MPTFDGTNLLITLDPGVTLVDVEADLYSPWKAWVKTGDNAKYLLAFRAIGGDPLTPGINAGSYFFIQNQNGWRIKPPEENITIYITGNLAPQDSSIGVVIPTSGAYTAAIIGLQPITQSVATLLEMQQQSIANIEHSTVSTKYLVEGLRDHHKGFGTMWYWDPRDGNDLNGGTSPTDTVQTFARAHDLAGDGTNDTIICVSLRNGVETIVTEPLIIDKHRLFVRGSGRSVTIKPLNANVNAVTINGAVVEVSGFRIETPGTGTGSCISISGEFAYIDDCWLYHGGRCGVLIKGGSYHEINQCDIEHAAEAGITIEQTDMTFGPPDDISIENCRIYKCANGIKIRADLLESEKPDNVNIKQCWIHDNTQYGIDIGAGVTATVIDAPLLVRNGSGNILNNGTNTVYMQEDLEKIKRNTSLIPGLL